MASIFSPRQQANIWIGLEALLGNKLRTFLTALGVVFGVAAVIAMLAIGNGAQQELLEQMKLVGVNNIIIKPVDDKPDQNSDKGGKSGAKSGAGNSEKKEQKKYSPGLSLADVEAINVALNGQVNLSPEIMLDQAVVAGTKTIQSKTIGVWNTYFTLGQLQLVEGQVFTEIHQATGAQVCVIGKSLKTKLFPGANALGKQIKVGKHWLKVIGVYEFKSAKTTGMEQLGIRDYNLDACIPLKTMLLRYTNRTLITQSKMKGNSEGDDDEDGGGKSKKETKTINQLDRIVVQVRESNLLTASADVCSRLLLRRHNSVLDFEITIPELLLKQQERTKNIFNIVLGAIAGISLLVGGIGIMNIMLASVLERIKEIGLRISLGAKRSDIVMQFLVESTLIACIGGFTGIALGITMAWAVSQVAQIPTVVSPISVIISFGVAAMVGLGFGIAPARRAASQNPIESLRYE